MPYVFISYSREDARDGLANRFYTELCVEIAQRGGLRLEDVGYIDTNLTVGDTWPAPLANALGDCRVFLPLVSPNYFNSDICGREWQAFWNRLTAYDAEHNAWPTLIVPVVWVPPVDEWPARTKEVQTLKSQLGPRYDQYGMRSLMQESGTDYSQALMKVAITTIEAWRSHNLVESAISPLSVTANFFAPERRSTASGIPSGRHERTFVRDYLERVREEHERLKFGDPTSLGFTGQPESAQRGRMRLRDVFIMPSVARRPRPSEASYAHAATAGQPAQEALDNDAHRHVVVLGPPGTGKTTLVHHLIYSLAAEPAERALPIHVRVGDVEVQPDDHVATLLSGVHELGRPSERDERMEELARFLAEEVERGDVVLCIDGLDEVPADRLGPVIRAVIEVADRFPSCRVIVTCREYDYANLRDAQRLPFPELTLLPFDIELIYLYVDRWYEAYTRLQPMRHANEKKRQLKDRIRENDDLYDLATTPILLTLITLMSVTAGTLPAGRSSLYNNMVRMLLTERAPWRAPDSDSSVMVEDVLPIAALVANRLQLRVDDDYSHAAQGFTMAELREIIETHVGIRPDSSPSEYTEALAKVSGYLARMTQTNGLVVDQGNRILKFAHRSLQEFLAGIHFLNGATYEEGLACAHLGIWRDPMLLMAGHGAGESMSLFYLVKFMTDLSSMDTGEDGEPLARLAMVAEMLAEIGRPALLAQGYVRVFADHKGGAPETGLWPRVVAELYQAAISGDDMHIATRVRVLSALGDLGDPRFLEANGTIRRPAPATMVDLPRGRFRLGTTSPDVIASSKLDMAPVREVTLPRYFIGRHPVVNVEYGAFIDAGGYEDDRYWDTEEARLWLHGDEGFIEQLYNESHESFERDFQPELADRRHSAAELLNNLRLMAASRKEPFFWQNHPLNRPNQPVVGVNWWEARAYCAWLNARRRAEGLNDGLEFRLPTEHEWERATRPKGEPRDYPWGNAPPDGTRAHYRDGQVKAQRATPVGAFPAGTWAGGPFDMAGNIWEWTASKAVGPGPDHDHERDQPLSVSDRVIRGGSWYCLDPTAMRTSYRGLDRLQNVYVDLGFRLAASHAASDEATTG
jgi:formylglycine-generating enzyme required for sulfatase activity/Cdc6-like AAA superfamily ATPase